MKGKLVMVGLMLSACGAPVSRTSPLTDGPVGFVRDGVAYTAAGQGDALAITRDGAAFGYDEGLAAKRAGQAFCSSKGRKLNPAAYGHYVGGSWLFQGGCA